VETKNTGYIGVQELSTIVNKSPQWIYKMINRKPSFKPYIKVIGNKKMVKKAAIWEVFGVEYEGHKPAAAKPDEEGESLLLEQLRKKDAQIEALQRSMEAMQQSINNLTEAIRAEQVLRANADNRIKLLEDKVKPEPVTVEPEPVAAGTETEPEPKEEPAAPVTMRERIRRFFGG
jgi:hypothetical protein